jgi:hypothetical protein
MGLFRLNLSFWTLTWGKKSPKKSACGMGPTIFKRVRARLLRTDGAKG